MKPFAPITFGLLMFLAPLAASQDDCFADPGEISIIDLTALGAGFYYHEERDCTLYTPQIPGCGFLTGNGTWLYEETNGQPGLQRGGVGLLGDRFPPGCEDPSPGQLGVLWQDPRAPYLIDASDGDPTQWTINPAWLSYWHIDPAGGFDVPCLIIGEDPVDETCVGDPDTLILGMKGTDVLPKDGYSIIKTGPLVNT